jgi:hypothetical protein
MNTIGGYRHSILHQYEGDGNFSLRGEGMGGGGGRAWASFTDNSLFVPDIFIATHIGERHCTEGEGDRPKVIGSGPRT